MSRWQVGAVVLLICAAVWAHGAHGPGVDAEVLVAGSTSSTEATTTSSADTTTSAAPTTAVTAAVPRATTSTAAATTSTTHPHPARVVVPQAWVPYATVGALVLHHPSDRVEAIGFHQSAQDGAQQQTALPTAVRSFTMTSRERDTIDRGAADIVVEPGRQLRAPVSGTVIRARSYTLYCDYTDQTISIEPDAHPGWQVRMLHIEGLLVGVGDRVEAGVTPIAQHARVLPFDSQVEEDTGLPRWPHTHVEVVDPTVPDRPTGPGCP